MRRLLFRLLQEMEQHHDTVLVCIVEESGSAPRGTGAWMLVNGTGRVAGTIGGGHLELRSIETAMVLLEKCRSLLKHFALNLTNGPDSLGMACGGDVTVHFQYLDPADTAAVAALRRLVELSGGGQGLWLLRRLAGEIGE